MTELRLDRANAADLPFIMATERQDGYDSLVGRWSEDRHRTGLGDDTHAYFIGRVGSEPIGFGIVRDRYSPDQVTLIRRLAVCSPGQGYGRRILAAITDAVFQQTSAYRLWLGLFPENIRARRTYEAVGFVAEGVARGSAYFGGVHKDELSMSILRPEWEAKNRAAPSPRDVRVSAP